MACKNVVHACTYPRSCACTHAYQSNLNQSCLTQLLPHSHSPLAAIASHSWVYALKATLHIRLPQAKSIMASHANVDVEDPGLPEVIVRPYNLAAHKTIRDLDPSDIDKLICVEGMVTRTSNVIPDLRVAAFRCAKCAYESYVSTASALAFAFATPSNVWNWQGTDTKRWQPVVGLRLLTEPCTW